MKKVSKELLEKGEYYLVSIDDWSESGFDICEFRNGELQSQSNMEDLMKKCKAIYELPTN